MQDIDWTTLICYGSIAILILVVTAPIFIFVIMIGKKANKNIQEKQEKREQYKQSIRDNGGLLAPGVIVGAKVIYQPSKRPGSQNPFIVDFEVDVTPENGMVFRTKFREEIFPNGEEVKLIPNEQDAENYQLVSEYGKKVKVMYDPTQTSRAYFDTYDLDNSRSVRTIWKF